MLGDRTVIPASRDPNTKQELSAARHAGDLGRIFFDHDALCVTEINSRSTAGLRPEVADLIHVHIKGRLLSFAH